ncbi:MAG: hypothetical protein IT210_05075 [Armatimonadetes bacterium]|nr:hypothetical protein [Armatimonadota bacterium]
MYSIRWLFLLVSSILGTIVVSSYQPVGATCTAGLIGMPPMGPKTFSGTACSISAWVITDIGYITEGAIYIGGERTKWICPANQSSRLDFGVTFDSTHFSHNSSILIEVWGKNSLGQEGRSQRIFLDKIYNKYSVFCYNEIEHNDNPPPFAWPTFTAIKSYLGEMRHGQTYASQSGWNKANVLNSVKLDTAIHIATHGINDQGVYIIISDIYNGNNNEELIWSVDVAIARQYRTAIVPVNLVYINACETWDINAQLWADTYGISSSSLNRAYVGWYHSPEIVAAQKAAIQFWALIRLGNIVSYATTSAQAMYNYNYPDHGDEGLARTGDSDTKLHGVYHGESWEQWWR